MPAGRIPESEEVRRYDMEGQPMLNLPECSALESLRRCLDTLFGI
jgi:hypothetical protein